MSKYLRNIIILIFVSIFWGFAYAPTTKAGGPLLGPAYMSNLGSYLPYSPGRCLVDGNQCGVNMTPFQCCEAKYGIGSVATITPVSYSSFGGCCYTGTPNPWDGTACSIGGCESGVPSCEFSGQNYDTYYNCYGPEATPTCTLSANPTPIISGNSSTLTWWTAVGADTATIDNGIGNVTPVGSGKKMVSPIITTTYTMTVAGPGGSGTCSATINVTPPPVCPTGGLVPCGRSCDDLNTTDIDESKPCDLCAAFYMLKNIINFVTELAVGIAIFIIVIAGLLYVFSAGEPGKIESAKSAITYALAGLALIFAAWLVIAIILQGLGYADLNTWNQVNCTLQT